MASMNFSLAVAVLLYGVVILILGTTEPSEAVCTFFCVQGTYITCRNYAGNLTGCACQCAPANGKDCVVHSDNGTTLQRC
ncbi:hypothetical protein PR202_ga13351 [Eleusine coracana subsp. coracana]|uniref:Uncharacterized protein n=1 Tax=Eleusine coracana subsp. coracana TaxID=191504 RepID=A0AAV5CEN2_ELECO|nr:hypothetical protein PR202_ga13351 [Eleusine coracana subsp. coracana]